MESDRTGKDGETVVILLGGGTKKRKGRDIATAKPSCTFHGASLDTSPRRTSRSRRLAEPTRSGHPIPAVRDRFASRLHRRSVPDTIRYRFFAPSAPTHSPGAGVTHSKKWDCEAIVVIYPLMFSFREDVNGRGYLARVSARGRALVVDEGDQWWVYGVEPGAIAASGHSPVEACLEFERSFQKLLFDFAEDAPTFDSFKAEVSRFFHERDEGDEQRWLACASVPIGTTVLEKLQVLPPSPALVDVERLDESARVFTPAENKPAEFFVTTTAA